MVNAAPLRRRLRMIVRKTCPKDLFFARRGSQLLLEFPDESQIDVLLVHNKPVEFYKCDFTRHAVETVAHERIFQELNQQRLMLWPQLSDRRIICRARLFFLELADNFGSRLPLVTESSFVLRPHSMTSDESDEILQRRTPRQI